MSTLGFHHVVARLGKAAKDAFCDPSAHAAPRLRIQACQRRTRHTRPAALPRAQKHPTHGALHRAKSRPFPGLLAVINQIMSHRSKMPSDRPKTAGAMPSSTPSAAEHDELLSWSNSCDHAKQARAAVSHPTANASTALGDISANASPRECGNWTGVAGLSGERGVCF
jgi:hypothetical protein